MFSLGTADPGRTALNEIDRVRKGEPRKDDHALSEATRELAQMREEMLKRRDGGEAIDGESLSQLNAVIAVVMAMHFPVGQPPWKELEKARDWLKVLLSR